MSNRYIYPQEKFKIDLHLEVDVSFVGVWDGVEQSWLEERYQEMLKDGSFSQLIRKYIVKDLVEGEAFDIDTPEPFDRLAFTIKEIN